MCESDGGFRQWLASYGIPLSSAYVAGISGSGKTVLLIAIAFELRDVFPLQVFVQAI